MSAITVKKAAKRPKFTYDKAFQLRLLRTMFQDQDFTCTTGIYLSPAHFEKKAHRWVAQAIIHYATKHGHGIGVDALKIELDRSIKTEPRRWTTDLVDAVKAVIERLDAKVKDKSFIKEELYRFIKHQATRDAIIASLDHLDAQDFEAIDQEFNRVLEVQESFNGGLGQFFVRDIAKRTKARQTYEKNGVSTGLKLDEYLKPGGLPPKALGVVVAPSGKGKSHILVHLGKSAVLESQKKVLHITLEMSEEMVLDRYDASFSTIPLNRLEDKPKAVRKKVRQLGKEFGEFLVVKEFPPASLTVPALRAYIRQLERIAFYPDVIIVDYADLLLPSQVGRERDAYEEMGLIYQELRRLSYEINCPIWTASQTNKEALNKEHFDWNSIADSSKKVHVADLIILFQQTLAEKKKKQARIGVGKNRFGPDKFDIGIRVDWSRSTIRS